MMRPQLKGTKNKCRVVWKMVVNSQLGGLPETEEVIKKKLRKLDKLTKV